MFLYAGASGSSTIEHFGHHIYEPARTAEQPVIIPLTKRTEELFGGIYSQHLHRNPDREEPSAPAIQAELDIAMENVLTWSLAKNISALEFAQMDNLEHTAGLNSPDFRRDGSSIPRRQSIQLPERNCDEWVREVPVELFTVSKSVVNKYSKSEERSEEWSGFIKIFFLIIEWF